MKKVSNFISNFSSRLSKSSDVVLLDFGSSQARMYCNGELIKTQPSFFSVVKGNRLDKFHLVDQGTITDLEYAVRFLHEFLKEEIQKGVFAPRFTGYYLIPQGMTEVEQLIAKRVLAELPYGDWNLFYKKDVVRGEGGLVIDIGFDLTELVLGIGSSQIEAKTIKYGSRAFTEVIREVVRNTHQLEVSWTVAEKIKQELSDSDFLLATKKTKQKLTVRGKDIYSFVPKTIIIDAAVFQEPLLHKVQDLFEEIKLFFSAVSTNVLMNSIEKGLDLWGDGGKLAGLDDFFAKKLQTSVKKGAAVYEQP